MSDIEFFLPDFYARFYMIILLYDFMDKSPGKFYENARISAAYGCFPGSIWNGGRVMLGSCTKQEMEFAIKELADRKIAMRYTFTNPLIGEKHLNDTFCNLCMELGDNGQNEVLVNSTVLEAYLRKTYPNYKVISSTTKCLRTREAVLQELEKDYYLVVLDSAFNNTDELFQMERKDKIELLVNHYCMDDCPNRTEHYDVVGRCQLEFSEIKFNKCTNINRNFYQIMQNRSFITTDNLYGRYANAGFSHFKIDGRAFNKFKVLESYMYYLVRPEYRDEVRLAILKQVDKL